jgi:hypothetical protein
MLHRFLLVTSAFDDRVSACKRDGLFCFLDVAGAPSPSR